MKHPIKFYVFTNDSSSSGNWRWHAKRAGNIVADSSQGYAKRNHCLTMAQNMAAGRSVYLRAFGEKDFGLVSGKL